MRRLCFLLLLTCHAAAYTAPKGFYWVESGGFIGNQVNAISLAEFDIINQNIEHYRKKCASLRGQTYNDAQALENGLSELENNIGNFVSTSSLLKKVSEKNKPSKSNIVSLQSGVGYQFSKYFAVETNHFIFWSTAQLNKKHFEYILKTTREHGLIMIGKASLPVYPKVNIYIPLGTGLLWTHMQNGEDRLSIPMRIPFIVGLGGQYELSNQWALHGEWMHVRISEVGPFNLFKVGFHFYKT